MGVGPIFEGWERVQTRLLDRLPALGHAELGLRASPDQWPIWALVSHLAGNRVYWLCGVLRGPRRRGDRLPDPFGECWEDRLERRSSSQAACF